jgi:hypothetical protein
MPMAQLLGVTLYSLWWCIILSTISIQSRYCFHNNYKMYSIKHK